MHPAQALSKLRLAVPVIAGSMLMSSATLARAETCLEQTQQLARDYDLSIDPPELSPGKRGGAVTPEALGEAGGVIEPPLGQDESVIEPPEGARDGMPTVPKIPSKKIPEDEKAVQPLSAAARTTLEALLLAARSEARRNREEDCFERLNEAKAFVRRELKQPG